MAHDVDLADEDGGADGHGDGDDGQVDAGELEAGHADVLAEQDVAPQQAGQGGAEGRAEGPVVDPQRHAVHRAPERPVADRHVPAVPDRRPRLDHPRQQDRRPDVGAGELEVGFVSYPMLGAFRSGGRGKGKGGTTYMTSEKGNNTCLHCRESRTRSPCRQCYRRSRSW